MEGMPLCDNSTTFKKYDKYQDDVMFMQRNDLIRTTRCFLPCTFMEYKVCEFDTCPLILNVYCLQITEDPIVIQRGQRTGVRVLASDTIKVLREEEAFSFVSLVADCGGVLGLFIGFNFLMIWDWIVKCF